MIEIIPYEQKYLEEIITLVLHIQQDEFNVPITLDDQPDLNDIQNFYQAGNGNFWIAVNDGKVVGTIALKKYNETEGALRKMFVHEKYRGKQFGAARMLMQSLLDWSKDKDIRTIYLGTRLEMHAAHRFYEKNSFVQIVKEALPEDFPLMQTDNRFYRWSEVRECN